MTRPAIVASVLGADYSRLAGEVLDLQSAGVDRIQWDVMDGHFVSDMTFGAAVVAACRPYVDLPFEAHLMIEDPDPVLEDFVSAGCSTVIVHVETCPHLHRTLSRIRELGARAGVAVNPATSLGFVPYVLDRIDHLLVMTVEPGFAGQDYIDGMERKVSEARDVVDRSGRSVHVEVDGGISARTVVAPWRAGADLVVVGSALLGHPGGKRVATEEIRAALDEAGAGSRRDHRTTSVADGARLEHDPIDGGERAMTENAMRESQDRLLRQAAVVLRARHGKGRYPDVSSAEAEGVVDALEAAATARELRGIDRRDAVALAHRLLDDDHPEASPLWPRSRR